MNRIGMSLIIMTFLGVSGAQQFRIHNGVLTAQAYLDMAQIRQRTYVMGFLDGMFIAPMFGAPDDNKLLVTIGKCVEGMNDVQLAAIVEKYVRNHPESWHLDVKLEAFKSLREVCSPQWRAGESVYRSFDPCASRR